MVVTRDDFARSPGQGEINMRTRRSIMLAMAATLGASGCRAWNPGSLLAPNPRPLVEQTLEVDEFVAAHNQNAEQIQSVEGRPTIKVQGKLVAMADGRLALERPRNFKLELLHMGSIQADIGSNDEEFWFWVNNDDRKVYWCNYDELDSGALAVTYQPDWIIEALGLKPITPEEAKAIKVHEGEIRGTTALVFPAQKNGSATYSRMMIVWNQTQRIKEHRIYEGAAPTPRGLLAQAEVKNYVDFPVDSSESATGEKCHLPESFKLVWKRDQLALEVMMRRENVKVNQFDSSRSAKLFVEPVTSHDRVNLAELSRSQRRDPSNRTRQTLPSPAARGSAKLGRPASMADDPTRAPRAGAGSRSTLGSATTPLEGLVTAPLPVTAETPAMQSAMTSPDLYQIGR
jgi:hypothetical protein